MYPCETFARHVLPVFRLLVAKELIEKYDFTQIDAAKNIGITQAAISQYIHLKRGRNGKAQFESLLPAIQTSASKIAYDIATRNIRPDEIMLNFCKVCATLREERKS